MSMDFHTRVQITDSIERINKVLQTGIFNSAGEISPLQEAAFTEIILCLNDLLQKSKTLATKISFQEDLSVVNDKIVDITDTISVVRNAICHIPSKSLVLNNISSTRFNFLAAGRAKLGFPGGSFIEAEYADDVCFYVGPYRLYLDRHIIRAFNEVQQTLDSWILKPTGEQIVATIP
jgi:hypothetical protein